MFDYAASNYSYFTIDEQETENGEDTYTAIVQPNQTVTLAITGADSADGTASLILNNFDLASVAENAKVTVNYNASMGSIKIGNTEDTDGSIVVDNVGAEGILLTAKPMEGFNFDGWFDVTTEELLSSALEYHHVPTGDITIEAVFSTPRQPATFKVGKNTYDTLTAAVAAAPRVYFP